MKKLTSILTLALMMLCVMKANAEWKQVYKVDYSDYTSCPFYVMSGFTPQWVDGVMVDQGSTGWHQYFIADGIPTQTGDSYTVKAMAKASEEISINVNMGWGWNDGEQAPKDVTIGTQWQEVTWEYDNIGGTSCNLVAQSPKGGVTIEWKYLEVGYEDTGEVYTVVGTNDLTGYTWDVSKNKMKYSTETGLYSWVAKGITVKSDSDLAFKIVKDSNWDTSWPQSNWVINTDVTGGMGIFTITITFNAVTKDINVAAEKTESIVDEWTDIIINGDMEGDNTECFYVTEQGIGGPFLAPITDGIGKDGSKAVKVESYDSPAQDWDSQFFIRLPYQLLPEGKFKISFDYKADKAGDFDTQSHTEPGGYIHWACVGSGSFTTDWKHYEAEGTISAEMSKEGQRFQTICFNLAKNKVRTNFIFDNVKFEIPTELLATLTKNPAVDPKPYTRPVYNSMAIVGDFLGLSTEENPFADWDPATGWQMTQDAENPAVWTLVRDEFTAEAKTYEYKATANGKWGDYELPNVGNADYNFDTPNLGAGKYNLEFTVDTRLHSLDLDVQKTVLTTYTVTFTTDADWTDVYAYAWSEKGENVTEYLGGWPGTKLEAVNGVYTVSIETTVAPEKIIFNNGNGGEGNQTGNLDFVNGSAYEFKAASAEEDPVKVAPEGWTSGITNGNLAGDDVSSFVMKEYPSVDIVPAAIVVGAGTNGSRGILVKAGDDTENKEAAAWDSQFWIVLDDELPSGTKLHVEFDYKASQAAKAETMSYGNPGAYQHWTAIGDVNFTTEWQHFSADVDVNDAMAKGDNGNGSGTGLKSIGFCLQVEKSATDYRFDNFGVWYQKPDETPEEHDYVDLGLPSGTLWATCNVGANSPEEYGDYFAWGETEPKVSYGPDNYKYGYEGDMTKYCPESFYGYEDFSDDLTELLPKDDAATVNWGNEWKMPSREQIEELLNSNYTTAEVTTLNGVTGYKITSNLNGESIFLPAAGLYYYWLGEGVQSTGTIGGYWSRSLYGRPDGAYSIYYKTNSKPICLYGIERFYGLSVRPVSVYAKEVYTDFVEETGTLTYYYDLDRALRSGVTEIYDPFNTYEDNVRFKGYHKKVTKVAIDPSMKQAPLTSFRNMAYGGMDSETFTMYYLPNVTSIEGLENLNTEIVTDMNSMFVMYTSLEELDLSSFNTSKVTDMNGMFLGCNKLQTLDLTSFDVSNVKDMRMMFGSCYELTTIYCNDDWSQIVPLNNELEDMSNMYVMFSGCKKLVGGQGTAFDSNVINGTYARPDGGTESPGYFTEKPSLQGDLNGDGKVDIADAVTVLNIMAAGEYNASADLNGDGKNDIADFVTILNIMAAQ